RVELKAEGYSTFADACAKVITIHKRLEKEETRNKSSRNESNPHGVSAPVRIVQRDATAAAPTLATNQFAALSAFEGAKKICTYCRNIGHLFHECRKRQYHANQANGNNNNSNNNNHFNNPRGNNFYNNHNNSNSNNYNSTTPPNAGNRLEASATGTNRGQGNVRPVHTLECTPGDYTCSDPIPLTYPSSSFDPSHSEDP
ncbi:hypothetical protein ALC57_08258, partial [Trachymyrmex cornetzi]